MKDNTQISYRTLCKSLPLSLPSLMRWKRRAEEARPLLAQPGPKKAMPLPIKEFKSDLQSLRYGAKRVKGVGIFYQRYRGAISRRDLQQEVERAHREVKTAQRSELKRIEWKYPGTAWAIDATEVKIHDRKVILYATIDMASRYRLNHLMSNETSALEVATHLTSLFIEHGAPLFLKRDNGSVFKNEIVDELLAKYGVIALNSPPHYPRYNGSIEKSIRDFKDVFRDQLEQTVHGLNHRSRRCLKGRTACDVYHDDRLKRTFSMKERHAIFGWIRSHSLQIIQNMSNPDHRSVGAAWRIAAENWLRRQNLITVARNKIVLPNLLDFCSHN